MKIVYIDNHLCVLDKPAGVLSQAAPGQKVNVVDQAKAWIKKKYDKPGRVFLEPIHRLDQPVSGLLLCARTSKALSRLQAMMRERRVHKWYYAWVESPLPTLEGRLENYLIHADHVAQVVGPEHKEGKQAVLTYTTLKTVGAHALIEIYLETGRYHQIRAQLAAARAPILGDRKYGSTTPWAEEGIALHHGKLSIVHPVTQEAISWVSASGTQYPPLPKGWPGHGSD